MPDRRQQQIDELQAAVHLLRDTLETFSQLVIERPGGVTEDHGPYVRYVLAITDEVDDRRDGETPDA